MFLWREIYAIWGRILFVIACFAWQAFHSVLVMAEAREKHPEFCIPMTVIPATISNNVPGTDFSLGADTALNEIADVSTLLKNFVITYQNN